MLQGLGQTSKTRVSLLTNLTTQSVEEGDVSTCRILACPCWGEFGSPIILGNLATVTDKDPAAPSSSISLVFGQHIVGQLLVHDLFLLGMIQTPLNVLTSCLIRNNTDRMSLGHVCGSLVLKAHPGLGIWRSPCKLLEVLQASCVLLWFVPRTHLTQVCFLKATSDRTT